MILAAAVLSIVISSPVCSSPCTVRVTVKIEHASARDRCDITIDGENEYRVSEITVENDRRTYERELIVHNPGEYTITATLRRPVNHEWEVTRPLIVR